MLRLATITALLVIAAPAYAQQDPELEREEATETDRDDSIDEADGDTAAEPTVEPGATTPTTATTSTSATSPAPTELRAAPVKRRWKPRLVARVRAGAGVVSGGDAINPGSGAVSMFAGELTAAVKRRRLELSVPLEYRHRQTFATSLSEMRGRGGVRVAYRFSRTVRAAAELGLGATWKPDWVDPFQPLDDGGLGTTNRYSHWDRRASAELITQPAPRQRVRVAYDYVLSVYQHDPMFDAIYDPLHLAPWDRDVHRFDAEWRWRNDDWRVRVGAQASRWQYFFMFAGDAKTGVTHSGTGGEPPNPLLELRVFKPRVAVDYGVTNWVRVGARYELELMQDPYDGYLSYVGHHPELSFVWELPRSIDVSVRAELYLRRYGPNSYAYEMDPDHPPLAWGSRRQERLGYVTLAASRPFGWHWSAIAEGKLAVRHTNYAYSIDWNYVNYLAWAGAEYRY